MIRRERGRQDLDRHVPTEARIAGAVDLSHTTGPDDDLIRAEPAVGLEGHGRFQRFMPRRLPALSAP